jgi:hypothetical protein
VHKPFALPAGFAEKVGFVGNLSFLCDGQSKSYFWKILQRVELHKLGCDQPHIMALLAQGTA